MIKVQRAKPYCPRAIIVASMTLSDMLLLYLYSPLLQGTQGGRQDGSISHLVNSLLLIVHSYHEFPPLKWFFPVLHFDGSQLGAGGEALATGHTAIVSLPFKLFLLPKPLLQHWAGSHCSAGVERWRRRSSNSSGSAAWSTRAYMCGHQPCMWMLGVQTDW